MPKRVNSAKAAILCAAGIFITCSTSQAPAQLRAGASRVEITPATQDLAQQFTSIETPLFTRSLVLENRGKRIVIVVADVPTIATKILEDVTKRIAAASGAPVENVLVAVTHTHNSFRLDYDPAGGVLPRSIQVTNMTEDRMVASVLEAVSNLRPARAGYATGVFHLARPQASGDRSADAGHPQATASATIGVFKVENEAGDTIAMLVNGGPEPVMGMSLKSRISSDVAGVMERYVEQRFSDKAVVLYTVGSPPTLVVDSRKKVPGTTPVDPDKVMAAVGTVLGEEVLTTSLLVKTESDIRLSGAAQVLTCPGKVTTPLNNPVSCSDAPGSKLPPCVFKDRDTDPIMLRMGVIQLGKLSIVNADSNISSTVWAEVKDQAPSPADTELIALTYGPMHYVQPDIEYPTNSYPVTATTAKRGCAEKGFVETALKMLKQGAASGAK